MYITGLGIHSYKALGIAKHMYPLEVISRLWAFLTLWIANIEIVTEGDENLKACEDKPTILLYSHSSTIDPMAILTVTPLPTKFIFKKELLYMLPMIFPLSALVGHIPIDRFSRDQAVSAINKAAKRIKDNNTCVVISPEGTRSRDGTLQAFKKGPFHMALQTKAMIAPVCVFGSYELWPVYQFLPNSGKIFLRYLPPFQVDDDANVDELLERTRNCMVESMKTPPAKFEPLEGAGKCNHAIITLFVYASIIYCLYNYVVSGSFFRWF
ncbi:hypothetical protein SAMD00019534_122510 [Acytostelium subglobosum LB1]|uniref:hypothetical protein n=1 Tax=Acytostelium subglobosum LB1 TaxID=1410327 RepID=UPI0006449EA1|nr:hypothetical protein SAMD00019534_122510 [Acytostelium subglobosum LB1]GAM29075.1 hypothetical protein SAMD00019534_122510 [Acytostelium subglobosum LB1]|eukprot:XP_012747920.1 hypothetical protein SAMD00019534_122510 [Acytostelium subglobosum LB1]